MSDLRKILFHAVTAACVSVMLFGAALAGEAPDADINPKQQGPPVSKAPYSLHQEKNNAEKIIWTIQGRIGDKVLLVNSKGEVKPGKVGDEIDGCLVTGESVICDPVGKDKARLNVAKVSEVQQLRYEAGRKDVVAQALKRELDSARADTVQKESEIKRLTLLSTDLSGKLKEAERGLAQAKKDLADKTKGIRELKVTTDSISAAQAAAANKEDEIKRLTLLNDDLSDQLKEALKYVDKAKKDIADKTQEAAVLKEPGGQGKVDDLAKQLAAMGKKLQEKIAEVEAKSAELRAKEGELTIAKQQGADADSLYRQINSEFEAYKSKAVDKDTLIAHMDIHIRRLESQIAAADQTRAAPKVDVTQGPIDKDKESIVNAIAFSGKKLKTLEIGDVEIAYIGDDVYLRMDQGNNPHAESISKIAKKEFKYDKYVYYVINQSAIKVN